MRNPLHAVRRIAILALAVLALPVVAGNPRLYRVDTTANTSTIRNFGSQTVDLGGYWLCSQFSYTQIGSTVLLDGDTLLAPGADVTVQWASVNAVPRDLGLYETPMFASPSAMVDFVQWGGSGNGRESVAVSKGIWNTGDFIAGSSPHVYAGDGEQYGLAPWTSCGGSIGAGEVSGLSLGRAASGDLALTWGASCAACDEDYGIFEGTLGDFGDHEAVECSSGGSTNAELDLPPGNTYYLIVPLRGSAEGSYGYAADGSPRPVGLETCGFQWIDCDAQ